MFVQDQSVGYPSVVASLMVYGTLASSHLNVMLRCYDQGLTSPITGKKFIMTGMHVFLIATMSVCSELDSESCGTCIEQ